MNDALQSMGTGLRTTHMRICDDIHFWPPSSQSAVSPDKGRARFRSSRSLYKAAFCLSLQFRNFPTLLLITSRDTKLKQPARTYRAMREICHATRIQGPSHLGRKHTGAKFWGCPHRTCFLDLL